MCGSRGSAAHNSGSSVLKTTLHLSLGSERTGVVKGNGDAASQIRLEVQVLTLISGPQAFLHRPGTFAALSHRVGDGQMR